MSSRWCIRTKGLASTCSACRFCRACAGATTAASLCWNNSPAVAGSAMNDQLSITTDRFEHRQVKDHFINDCCFGEDFAAWLLTETKPLEASGFSFSEPIQEDYGWGFWATHGRNPFWVALSYCGTG